MAQKHPKKRKLTSFLHPIFLEERFVFRADMHKKRGGETEDTVHSFFFFFQKGVKLEAIILIAWCSVVVVQTVFFFTVHIVFFVVSTKLPTQGRFCAQRRRLLYLKDTDTDRLNSTERVPFFLLVCKLGCFSVATLECAPL